MLPILVLTIFINLIAPSLSYSRGAPASRCESLLPAHGRDNPIFPQTTAPPFSVVTPTTTLVQGNLINIKIETLLPEVDLKGYIINAKSTSPPYQVVGQFVAQDAVIRLDCEDSANNTVTHSSGDPKPDLELQWHAPSDFVGEIVFNATLVQSYNTFWSQVLSQPIKIIENQVTEVDVYEGCGTVKSCFGFPENCITGRTCQAVVTAQEVGDKHHFEIKSGHNNPAYIATALSSDELMGDDSVIECIPQQDGSVQAYHSWTRPRPNLGVTREGVPSNIIKILEGSYVDGTIYCKVEKDSVSTVFDQQFNLKNDRYHVMFASGTSVHEFSVGFHNVLYYVTPTALSLGLNQQNGGGDDSIYEGCGSTKICFGFPDDCVSSKSCRAVTTVQGQGTTAVFELQSGFENPAYVAVGISTDERMGDDSIMECIQENGAINVYSSFTIPRPNLGITRQDVPQNFSRLIDSSYVDGTIYCKIERDVVTSVLGHIFDLEKNAYNLMVASGSSIHENTIGYHDIGRIPAQECHLLNPSCVPKTVSKVLLRLHGAFMIVAWIGTASLGLLLARYYKKTWVGSSMCGKDQWFAWHRCFMVITWLLTMVGFIVIFVEINGWSAEDNPHAVLGTVTTVLCFIQPFGALLRPGPNDKNRPFFNYGHMFVGTAAHLLSIITIFFAVQLTKAELPEWMTWILVSFSVFHVLMHIFLQISAVLTDRAEKQLLTAYPIENVLPSKEKKQDAPYTRLRKVLLTVYTTLIILFVVALLVIVIMAPVEVTVSAFQKKSM